MKADDAYAIWRESRARQASQHPAAHVRSRGDHYRRKNTGIALRTFRSIFRRGCFSGVVLVSTRSDGLCDHSSIVVPAVSK